MNQIFLASTFFGAMNLATAIDEGHFGDRAGHTRTLLVSTNSIIPEATKPLDEIPGAARVLGRFDRVINWNRVLAPFHPSQFRSIGDPVITARWLKAYLGIDDVPVELILESVQVPPASTLLSLFADSPITVYSDGLMSYGPTRVQLSPRDGDRIERLLHLDLIPGLEPLLLSEFSVPRVPFGRHQFTNVVREVASDARAADELVPALRDGGRTALVLGQYLSPLGLISWKEEVGLYANMVRFCAEAGFERVVFKPHPTAPETSWGALAKAAESEEIDFMVLSESISLEHLLTEWSPDLVTGCFSTGLLIAGEFFGLPTARLGTEFLLERLEPFENSNRIPLVLTDAYVRALDSARASSEGGEFALQSVALTVGYAMQPSVLAARRAEVVRILDQGKLGFPQKYLPLDRVADLGLPGAPPSMKWRAKSAGSVVFARVSGFGRRYPSLARPYRAARRVSSPTTKKIAERMPNRLVRYSRALRAQS